MSKSSSSTNQALSSLRVFPLTACIHVKKRENGVREMHHSGVNLQWDNTVQWNVHVGDIIAVAVSPLNDDRENEGSGRPANSNARTLTKKEILDWKPIQDLQPKKKSKKAASSSSSAPTIHWRLAIVLALGRTMFRTADKKFKSDDFLDIEWVYRATESIYSKELGKSFRPYRPNDRKSQLQYVVLSTSEVSKISPMQVLPATIDMLTQAEINQGVDLESLNMGRQAKSHKFQLWNLPFYCPKRINAKGSLVPEDENGDVWSALSFSGHFKATEVWSMRVYIGREQRHQGDRRDRA